MKKKSAEQQEIIDYMDNHPTLDEVKKFMSTRKNVPLTPKMKCKIFLACAEVDSRGVSRKVGIDELADIHPDFSTVGKNGCDWARETGSLGSKYKVDRSHENGKTTGAVVAVQLLGKKEDNRTRAIRSDIYKKIKMQRCSVLDVGTEIQVDHKNGRYDDAATKSLETQKESDFQSLSRPANDAKRQHCKECKRTDCRYDAKRLGYRCSWVKGGREHSKWGCNGCYWHDPRHFNEIASANFGK